MATAEAPAATPDVDVVLDLRRWPTRVREQADWLRLWADIERALSGTDLRKRPAHQLRLPGGVLQLNAVRVRPSGAGVMQPRLTCRIVNVLEAPAVRRPCAACSKKASEGVFRCAPCGPKAGYCSEHAHFLDGDLAATCATHRPRCADCGKAATFHCAGEQCRGRRAFCHAHRRAHAQAPGWAYCPSCLQAGSPQCSVSRCPSPGFAACEFTDDRLHGCGSRLCTGHLRRWQIYGPDRVGLALCSRHEQALRGASPEDLVRRIVAGTHTRTVADPDDAETLPTVRGVEYTLRNFGHFAAASDPQWIHRTLCAAPRGFGSAGGAEAVAKLVSRRDNGGQGSWRTEMAKRRDDNDLGGEIWSQLCDILRREDGGADLARALEYQSYTRPRPHNGQPGRLFLIVPPARRRVFGDWQDWMGEQLTAARGVEIVVQRHRGGGR